MIIDFHTHIFEDSIAPRAYATMRENAKGYCEPLHDMTARGLLQKMDEAGVDKSVVLPVITKRKQTEKVNLWAAGLIGDKRLIPFGGIYPNADDFNDVKEQIDFVSSLGLKGIKLHAEYQNFWLDTPEMLRLYDYAFSKGLIIIHHAGYDPISYPEIKTSPKRFRHVMEELKGGIMIAAHFGGHSQWDEMEEYLIGTDIYLDTSMGFEYYGVERFERVVKAHGADKILFASDSPWSNTKNELRTLMAASITEQEKQLITEGNAKRLLKLD